MAITVILDHPLTQTYMAHSALLVVKLLALSPMATMTWVNTGWFPDAEAVRRAYLSELKNLAPFWIVGALYVTTRPTTDIGISLFRMFTAARMILILGYATKPISPVFTDFALILSYVITCYMSMYVVYYYRTAI
ncbi:hypothetical protein PYW08_003113 [Mythimna loreyi]|uniref:Uncharacterized protein n=1 Tax=Mythimna loreyi TaxID=667449 RepID=A0ACC2QQN2_9NEOP|nr:hypothetical protein PYW08_003113 [Mythimna loreyi]